MKLRIYIGTNIYINSILNRDNGISQSVLIFLENSQAKLYINDISIINIHYIVKKYLKENTIKDELQKIRKQHSLVSIDDDIFDNALDSNFKDFEDAVQYFCAEKINADLIITDNIKDFVDTDIKTIGAKEFYEMFIDKRMDSLN